MLHPLAKLICTALLIVSILCMDSLVKAIMLCLFLIGLYGLAYIPLRRIWQVALYPAFFSLIFAAFRLHISWQAGVIIVAKAVLAAMSMIFLIATTPYYQIMHRLSKFLPPLLIDILIFTYRSLFILMEQINNMLISIKIRGGYHKRNIFMNIRNMASTLAVLILHSFDMSERMYMIYTLRGYTGKIYLNREERKPSVYDIIFVSIFILVSVGVIFW